MSLDAAYGPAIPPQNPYGGLAVQPWEKTASPDSLTKLDGTSAASLRYWMQDLRDGWSVGRVLHADVAIIWLVDATGNIWFAIEELVVAAHGTGRPKHQTLPLTQYLPKLGHPALIAGANGRIAGEIVPVIGTDFKTWEISNKSGRYGIHGSRTAAHLRNVANTFLSYGISLSTNFIPA